MNASASFLARAVRPSILLVLLVAALVGAALAPGVRAADPSAAPGALASPGASGVPETMCDSVADLRVYVGFLRDQTLDDGGLVPMLVGAAASLSEARTLLGLVSDTYRPLVQELIGSLQTLKTAVHGFFDEGTIGAGLVQLGEAIAGVGASMDALTTELRQPCPAASPAASALPAPSGSPAA
jgi:hypothetical protein